ARALGPAGRRPRRARRLGPARVFRPGGPGHARSVGAPRDRREIAGSRRRAGRLRRDDHAAVAARGGPARPAVLDRAAGLGDAHAPVARRGPRRAARAPHAGPHRLPRDGPQARGGCRPPAAAAAADRLNAGRRGGDRTRTIAPRQGAVRLSGGSPVRRKVGTAHWQVPYGNGTRREDAVNHYDGPGNREPGDRGELSPAEAAAQIRFLEEEVALLRRKLTESPRHARVLEQRLAESASRLAQLSARNEKLTETLKEARSQLVALREEVDRLAQPPSGYGVFLTRYPDETVDVFTSGRRMRVAVSPAVDPSALRPGQTVRLNEALTVVEAGDFERVREVCALREVLPEPTEDGMAGRALVVGHADEERVVWLADPLFPREDNPDAVPLKPGDSLLVDTKAGYAYERVPKAEVEDLVLEEVPDVEYEDIGGL